MKILAIDDNPDNLTVLKAVVSDRLPGVRILTALNGRLGVELAQAEDPDVILLDIVMPGMDGYAVCRKLKEDARLQTTPVIFLTAIKTDRESRVKALEAGAEGFLAKPFDEIELIAQIRAMAKIKAAALMQRDDNARLAGLVAERTRALQESKTATLNLLEDLRAENEARKESEAALRKSEEVLSLFMKHSPIFAFIKEVTPTESRVLKASDNFQEMIGVPVPEMVGKTMEELFPADFAAKVSADDRAVVCCGKMLRLDEHLNGRSYTTIKFPIIQGNRSLLAGYTIDTTETKRAEAELQKMQKLQSVGTLAGGIAHDFNNILMGLFGNISLAKAELAKGHPGYLFLEEAEKSMSRAVRLTKQLLTFAKGGEPIKEEVSLGALVEEVARFDLSGSQVKLVYQQEEDLWLAEADKGQIQQVVSNLVINARQAMPAGGHLYVTLANADLSDVAVAGLRLGKYVKVSVRDEGGGIDPKHLERIFDPYFTTKQTGSGLGLATAYSVISKHGGHIGVISSVGQGSAFTFYLPASASPRRPEAMQPSSEIIPPARSGRILVMDDEEMVCTLVSRMLGSCGFAVTSASGGQEAVDRYKQALEAGEPYDAVIMDLTIPGGIGGKEAIKEILAIDPGVKAIVSSGYADDPVMANYAGYGFKGCAVKPYTACQLRAVVAKVLE